MAVTKKTAPEKAALSKKPAVKKAIPAKKPAKQKKGRYGAVPKYPSPPAKSIKHLRESVPGLLQQHAAVLVKSNLSTYGKWETGVVPMHPALWSSCKSKWVNCFLERSPIHRKKLPWARKSHLKTNRQHSILTAPGGRFFSSSRCSKG